MAILWIVTVTSLLAALLAWRRSLTNARKLEELSQMYWEIKYRHGELRVQVQRLLPQSDQPASREPGPSQESLAGALPRSTVIPLSSLRR